MYYVKVIGVDRVDRVGGFWETFGRILGEIVRY